MTGETLFSALLGIRCRIISTDFIFDLPNDKKLWFEELVNGDTIILKTTDCL